MEKLQQEWHALCIVNTRKRAQRGFYERLQGEGVYHLSTTMYPAHRRRGCGDWKRLKDETGKNASSFRPVSWKPEWDLDFTGISGTSRCGFHYSGSKERCNEMIKGERRDIVRIFQWEDKERVVRDSGSRSNNDENLQVEGRDTALDNNITEYFRDYIASRAKARI